MGHSRSSTPKVTYWNNIPTPYMVERFNEVARRGNLRFDAWFTERREPDRSWNIRESEWRFPYRYLPAVRMGDRCLALPPTLLSGKRDLLVSLYSSFAFVSGWASFRLRGSRTAFWSEVTFDRWIKRRAWREYMKSKLFTSADGILTAGDDGRRFAQRYGCADERIHIVRHVVDVDYFHRQQQSALATRSEFRDRLGLAGVTFAYVGRLWWGKGLDALVAAFGNVQQNADRDVSLLIVGDGPEESRLKAFCRAAELRNVAFVGFVQKEDLPRYYAAADAFVFPTLGDPYGLVVDEAMACSLPVLTTTAVGEIGSRVVDGENGYLVPPENAAALAGRMQRLLDDETRRRLGQRAFAKVADQTVGRWAEEFETAVERILDSPRVPLRSSAPKRHVGRPRRQRQQGDPRQQHSRPLVVYWNNMPAPYVVGRFNALADRGTMRFEAWFGTRRELDRSWAVDERAWRFAARYVLGQQSLGFSARVPVAEFSVLRPSLVVCPYAPPEFALGALAAKGAGSRVVLRVLPTYSTWVRRSATKELAKHLLFRLADGAKVPGNDGANVARKYGMLPDRVFSVLQSIDVEHFSEGANVAKRNREKVREELGVRGCVFLYAGRLWSGKGLDHLFEAYRALLRRRDDVSLLMIGDGVDEERYRVEQRGVKGMQFLGFVQRSELPAYYAAADVFVLPTLGDPHGLVVEEAMAAGLPVVCSESAGDIRTRLPNGVAGVIVPPGDSSALATAMFTLAADPTLRREYGAQGRRLAETRDHAQWALEFERLVDSVLSMPIRRRVPAVAVNALARIFRASPLHLSPSPLARIPNEREARHSRQGVCESAS
jgi:glycosyltransferase involved in cell wall biosynthesis